MKTYFVKLITLTLISSACCSVSAQSDLGTRSQDLTKSIFVDLNGADTNDGTSAATPLKTISAAITKAYAYGKASINLAAGTYPHSNTTIASDSIVISGHPWLEFKPTVEGNSVTLKHGFRILGGSKVNFRDIDFVQDGEVGNTQIDLENSHVFIDDSQISYVSGDAGFLEAKNSWAHIRTFGDSDVNVNYSSFPLVENPNVPNTYLPKPIIEAHYGSYLSVTANSQKVNILLGDGNKYGIYLTASKMYGSNVDIEGSGRYYTTHPQAGIFLNRASDMRLIAATGFAPYINEFSLAGILSKNGSRAYLGGPMRIRFNGVGLRVASGGDIRYGTTGEEKVFINSNPESNNDTDSFKVDNSAAILKAY